MVASYTANIGGDDLLDRFLPDYRPRLRSKKWWWILFASFLNMSVVAAWRIRRRYLRISHIIFRRYISGHLVIFHWYNLILLSITFSDRSFEAWFLVCLSVIPFLDHLEPLRLGRGQMRSDICKLRLEKRQMRSVHAKHSHKMWQLRYDVAYQLLPRFSSHWTFFKVQAICCNMIVFSKLCLFIFRVLC